MHAQRCDVVVDCGEGRGWNGLVGAPLAPRQHWYVTGGLSFYS